MVVGQPMTLNAASIQIMQKMKHLVLFGDHIGGVFYPEINTVIDPRNHQGVYFIKKVKSFERYLGPNGIFKWKFHQKTGNLYKRATTSANDSHFAVLEVLYLGYSKSMWKCQVVLSIGLKECFVLGYSKSSIN
ncbi:hypothetical protein OROGR_024881 [Orobanche gracilis]